MNKKKDKLRQQQRKKMKQHKIEPSIDGTIDGSKKIIERCLSLPEVLRAQNIFIYASMVGEVMTDDLILLFLKQGKRVCVPKVLNIGMMIPVEIYSLDELLPGKYGFHEPQKCMPFKEVIDLVIVPGLAFDQQGNRLGHGGGYFDRYFEVSPRQNSIGLAFDWQIIEKIPSESHDHQIDIVLTAERTYR